MGSARLATARVEFLTREGCANTPAMWRNLLAALREVGAAEGVVKIDAGSLPAADTRRGFGTPTVLVEGRELMGLANPEPGEYTPG